mmetsp:Transcript_102307/g.312914  ORF Transcript_102307/g.312914 Transcript_102307/m.312914 type:complete len:333 (-) Transcript_102307:331-1329(-)
MSWVVADAQCKAHTELVGSTWHPERGDLLFARSDVRKGTVLLDCPIGDVVLCFYPNVDSFAERLRACPRATELLQHSCPTGDGRVAEQDLSHFNALLNPSATPNCVQHCTRFAADSLQLVALTDVRAGQEFTVNYDHSVGYERCGGEPHVQQFLVLCQAHAVEKRPSLLTGAPVEVVVRPAVYPRGGITFVYSKLWDESRHFWGKVMGLRVRADKGSVVFYELPGTASSLGVVKQGVSAAQVPPCSAAQCGRDCVMLCLVVDDVQHWFERFGTCDYTCEQPPTINTHFGIHNLLVRDPDGYLVELQQFLDPAEQAVFGDEGGTHPIGAEARN